MNRTITLLIVSFIIVNVLGCATITSSFAYDLKSVVLNPDYKHDRFNTQPKDIVRFFRAYTVSFDGKDDNNNDGAADKWGIPEWVAYELHKTPQGLGKGPKRPSKWITDKSLHNTGIAPDDDSYKHSGYSRGHMCMKSHAWRLGETADWNTHTVLNACPQIQKLNAGSWLALEFKTGKWADQYGKVWIICGPIINNLTPTEWIGDSGEIKAVVPDAFFKIVVKQSGRSFDILAFIFPKDDEAGRKAKLETYLTSVDNIEKLTGIDFLTSLDDSIEEKLESKVASELWDGSNRKTGEYHFHNRSESGESLKNVFMPKDEVKNHYVNHTSIYYEASGKFTGKYKTGDVVELYNSANACFAIYRERALKDAMVAFTNGITREILAVSDNSYQIKIREYTGWIPEGVIIERTDIHKVVEQTIN